VKGERHVPKIIFREQQIEFLRALLRGFLHTHGITDDPDIDSAEEWLVTLGYVRYFKKFSVEVEPDEEIRRGRARARSGDG
jgi:hypothetical protein